MTKLKIKCEYCGRPVSASHIAAAISSHSKPGSSEEMRRRANIRWDRERSKNKEDNI